MQHLYVLTHNVPDTLEESSLIFPFPSASTLRHQTLLILLLLFSPTITLLNSNLGD